MSSRDGIFGKVSRRKTTPGSVASQTQYKRMRRMPGAQWVFISILVALCLAYSLYWIVLLIVATGVFGIPAQRKILRRFRDNAYPDGPPDE